MAINQEDKALNLAAQTVRAVEEFMGATETLRSLEAQRVASGLSLTDYDAAYAASTNLRHIDGTALNAVLFTSVPAIWAFMVAGDHDDNLQKVRA